MSSPVPDSTAAFDPAATHLRAAGESLPNANGERVGGYRLLRMLGAGGMGKVYEAEEVATGRRVALKLIAQQFATSPDAVERFRQEGRLASGIVHPRCVFVLAAEEDAGRPYIVMELMPGETLKDLVDQRGPLPIEEAVARILDVIDGLQQAHALAVIHRDVKPSNCFLDGDGRVKIGDFGLSKSLVADVQLSQTGKFLGTLLFASPEQIRGEPIDQQTDVYSVAATLYFLLTGHAPFEGGDAAATLARIVADPPTPLRSLRPEVPKGLNAAVLRGLERNRQRRWRDLAELREALLPYLPGYRTTARRGIRVAALLIDTLLFMPLDVFSQTFLLAGWLGFAEATWQARLVNALVNQAAMLVYFALLEGMWGCSVGKWLLRLRVIGPDGDPPGLARGACRSLLFLAMVFLPAALIDIPLGAFTGDELRPADVLYPLALVLGPLAVFAAARAGNGYRGLHEFTTGTRVVALPWPVRDSVLKQLKTPAAQSASTVTHELPRQIGPYAIRGAAAWDGHAGTLLGEDESLGRAVWIEVREDGQPLDAARQAVARPARLRWLASGQLSSSSHWHAFVAPAGRPITALAAEGLVFPWSDVRPILEQLTVELSAAATDGTLPVEFRPEQVWVQPNGRVQLLDRAVDATAHPTTEPLSIGSEERAFSLLRQVTLLMLEGRPTSIASQHPTVQAVRAPIPEHASRLLSGLLGSERPYQRLSDLQEQLDATKDRPTRVTTGMRAGHLAVLAMLLSTGLTMMFGLSLGYSGLLVNSLSEELAKLQQVEYLREGDRLQLYLDERWPAGQKLDADIMVGGRVYTTVSRAEIEQIFADPQFQESLAQISAQYRSQVEQRAPQLTWLDRWLWRAEHERTLRLLEQKTTPPAADFTPEALVEATGAINLPALFLLAFAAGAVLIVVCFFPLTWILWSLLVGAGFSYRVAGVTLVRRDGRPAHRLQCVWRALLVWAPVAALLGASLILQAVSPELSWLAMSLGWAALLLLIVYVLLALWFPTRSLLDVLAGTWLVPK